MPEYLPIKVESHLDSAKRDMISQRVNEIAESTPPSVLYNGGGRLASIDGVVEVLEVTGDDLEAKRLAAEPNYLVIDCVGVKTRVLEPLSENMRRLMEELPSLEGRIYREGYGKEEDKKEAVFYELRKDDGIILKINHTQLIGTTTTGIIRSFLTVLREAYGISLSENMDKAIGLYDDARQMLEREAEKYSREIALYVTEETKKNMESASAQASGKIETTDVRSSIRSGNLAAAIQAALAAEDRKSKEGKGKKG